MPHIARYQVILRNHAGDQLAIFDKFASLRFKRVVNDIGSYELTFVDDGDERFHWFEVDFFIEVRRAIFGDFTRDYYVEFTGLHRRAIREQNDDGTITFRSIGVDPNELLSRSIIAYKTGTIRADKNDPAEYAMKTYVEENCGPTADDTVVGRLYQGGFPNFTVEDNLQRGMVWTGSRAYENLLDVLKEIADYTNVAFDPFSTEDYRPIDFSVEMNGINSFIFRTYWGQMGADRTTVGLDTSTGLNGVGNRPVIMAVPMGTISSVVHDINHLDEANVVVVLGEGDGSTRSTLTRFDANAILKSPWNRREVSRPVSNLNQDMPTHSMIVTGDEVLGEMRAKETFTFEPYFQSSLLYGIHYFLGDRITVNDGIRAYHKKITAVSITVENEAGEEIQIEFSDIPGV